MSKTFNIYDNNIDRTWYDSSNVLYSECDDVNNELKTLRVVFKNGRTYEYKDVNVHDYMLFREHTSQGQALNKYIKKYETKRIEDTDLTKLQEMFEYFQNDSKVKYPYAEIVNENIINIYVNDEVVNTFRLHECDNKVDVVINIFKCLNINYERNISDG